MKTVKQIIRYFKLLNEPNKKELARMAYESAREYYKDKPHTRLEFDTYQRSFIGAYQRTYAKNHLQSPTLH